MSTRRDPRLSMVEAVDETAEAEAGIAAGIVGAAAVVAVAEAAGRNLQPKRTRVMFFATARGTLPSAAIVVPGAAPLLQLWALGALRVPSRMLN